MGLQYWETSFYSTLYLSFIAHFNLAEEYMKYIQPKENYKCWHIILLDWIKLVLLQTSWKYYLNFPDNYLRTWAIKINIKYSNKGI